MVGVKENQFWSDTRASPWPALYATLADPVLRERIFHAAASGHWQ